LGSEPHTPIDDALRQTLQGLGCVRERAPVSAELRREVR
jgi:hypothetical protein